MAPDGAYLNKWIYLSKCNWLGLRFCLNELSEKTGKLDFLLTVILRYLYLGIFTLL